MTRTRLPLLAVFPVSVIALVVGIPFVLGNQPVRWESGSVLPHLVLHDDGSTTPPSGTGRPGGPAAPGGSTAPGRPAGSATPAPVTAVAPDRRWKPGMPQWGVQLYWEDNSARDSDRYVEKKARQQADYLVRLKANSVAVSFPFVTGNRRSVKIAAGPKTPSPERLGRVMAIFRQAGLRTTIRPIMDEATLGPPIGWRGNIIPADRGAWFASYKAFLTPYLRVAATQRVGTFVIGTELNSMEGDPRWDALVTAAEKVYKGEIAYDANWDNYVRGRIAMPVNHLGVDAYFPVKVPDTASIQALVAGWNGWLNRKSTGPLPRVLISEAGIGAMNGAYHAPGDFYTKRAVNLRVQANWYTAVCQVVRQRRMSGVYWWSIYFDDDPNTPPDGKASRLDFAGRATSEKAIRACFSSDYAGPGVS